jgi:hypothetical protein
MPSFNNEVQKYCTKKKIQIAVFTGYMKIISTMRDIELVDISGKDKECLEDSTNKHVLNCKNKNIRHIHASKKGYQPRANLVKGEKVFLLANSENNLNMCKYYFFHLLNVQRIS